MELLLLQALNSAVDWPGLHVLWVFINQDWSKLVLAVALVAWSWQTGRWRFLVAALLAVALADPLSSHVLKPFFERPRPCAVEAGLVLRFACGEDFSFPSSHAANTFALATAFGSPWVWGLAGIVGLQRCVVAAHYPTDVLAGALVGVLCGWVARRVVGQVEILLRKRGIRKGDVQTRSNVRVGPKG